MFGSSYFYSRVLLPEQGQVLYYRPRRGVMNGDTVIVPYGKNNVEMVGIVIDTSKYKKWNVPFPIERTKFIKRKAYFSERYKYRKLSKQYRNSIPKVDELAWIDELEFFDAIFDDS